MKRIHIPKKLYREIEDYCLFNNIKDISKEITSMLEKGFRLTQYGNSPFKENISFQLVTKVEEEKNVVIKKNDIVEPTQENIIEQIPSVKKEGKKKKGITIIKND